MAHVYILLLVLLSSACVFSQTQPSSYQTPTAEATAHEDGYSGWIQFNMNTWINMKNMDTNCTFYNDAQVPSKCPTDRELFDSSCVYRCPVGTTRAGPCHCGSDIDGKITEQCSLYGDPKMIGEYNGPTCARTNDYLFKSLCYNKRCPTGMMKWDACTCIEYTRTNPSVKK